ncbi:hypothetical protein [Burkholderia ubonensis]|nr:hypothetical protein [Burkholderia ubonensis]
MFNVSSAGATLSDVGVYVRTIINQVANRNGIIVNGGASILPWHLAEFVG